MEGSFGVKAPPHLRGTAVVRVAKSSRRSSGKHLTPTGVSLRWATRRPGMTAHLVALQNRCRTLLSIVVQEHWPPLACALFLPELATAVGNFCGAQDAPIRTPAPWKLS